MIIDVSAEATVDTRINDLDRAVLAVLIGNMDDSDNLCWFRRPVLAKEASTTRYLPPWASWDDESELVYV